MASSKSKQESVDQPTDRLDLPEKKSTGKKVLVILLVIVLIAASAFGAYYWQSQAAKKQQANLQKQIDELKKTKEDLEAKAKKAAEDLLALQKSAESTKTCTSLTQTQINNIHASIESGNTAALDGLMADNVQFVIAASEKGGTESKAQAIADLDYLTNGTDPWNWNIAAAKLNAYKAGDYKTYIADDTIFGVAANKYFVSIRVTCGKIDQIFVAANTDLL